MTAKSVIESKNLKFKPLSREYLDLYVKWLNDLEVNKFLGPIIGSIFTREKGEEWYEEMKDQQDRRIFTLHSKENGTGPIGYCGLYEIDHRHERASIQVIIGEKEYQNRGLGTEATRLLVDYGFSALGLESINLSLMDTNDKARQVPRKLGFREAGRVRDYWQIGGNFHDRVIMDIKKEEFYEENERKLSESYLNKSTQKTRE